MTQDSQRIFLSREGELLGPMTTAQLDTLRKSGEIARYVWLWLDAGQGWIPANAPPPPPPSEAPQAVAAAQPSVAVSPPAAAKPAPSIPAQRPSAAPPVFDEDQVIAAPPHVVQAIEGIAAICFDSETVVSGTLSSVSRRGCVLSSPQFASEFSPLSKGSKMTLNLLHESSGRSQTITAKLSDKRRHPGLWEYELQWDSIPALLEKRS